LLQLNPIALLLAVQLELQDRRSPFDPFEFPVFHALDLSAVS
jgi:hypothetical protein